MTKRVPVTTANPFSSCNPQGQHLFAVQAGIHYRDALREASSLIYSALELLNEADEQIVGIHASRTLIEMAQAVINAVEVCHD